jgi:hypothetical protein
MGIKVQCPNGHEFNVKDKYAGKKGICPFCPGQVVVRVPDATCSEALKSAALRAVREEHGGSTSSSVFDEEEPNTGDTGGSMLGSSVIRHHVKCGKCGQSVPMWFAKCPKCGNFMPQW